MNRRHLPTLPDRCTGHCCEHVFIPYSPEELGSMDLDDVDKKVPEMLELVGRAAKGGYAYRCVHWNPASGECMDYDNRPGMCRDYPYGRRCMFPGCTDPEARKPPEVTLLTKRGHDVQGHDQGQP